MGPFSHRAGPRSSRHERTPSHWIWEKAGVAARRPLSLGFWGQARTAAGGHQNLARQLWTGGMAGNTASPNVAESRQGDQNPHRGHDQPGPERDGGMVSPARSAAPGATEP